VLALAALLGTVFLVFLFIARRFSVRRRPSDPIAP
jgi:hypothetical protein